MRGCVSEHQGCKFYQTGTGECCAPDYTYAACATERIKEDNAVCICGCPADEHESQGEDGEQCEHEDHECMRVCHAVLCIVNRLRARLPADNGSARHSGGDACSTQ